MFKLPATLENGEKLSKEAFINIIQDETISYSSGIGLLGGSIPQMSYVSVQVEADGNGLEKGMQWIRRALYLTNITAESVKTAVQKQISEIPPQIRYGPSVAATVAAEMLYDGDKANTVACTFLNQKPFLATIFEGMEKGDDSVIQDVVKQLDGIRKTLFQTANMHAFVACNLKSIPNLIDTLVSSLSRTDSDKVEGEGRIIENVSASSVLKEKSSGGEGAIVALSAIESGFLNIIAPGVMAYDPNRAALLVAIEYLTALEGPFWVKLRGAGLTYG